MIDPSMNTAPEGLDVPSVLPEGFFDFFLPLHHRFTSRRNDLIRQRTEALNRSLKGQPPTFPPPSEATTGAWRISLPDWVADQRNQMTGPADDAELTVKMLNSGAPGVMLDLEDSMANTWSNLLTGVDNILDALYGDLTYDDAKRNSTVGINPSDTVILTRPRGLHLSQAGVVKGELTSASLFDVTLVAFQVEADRLKHPLSFYIPKTESADEALWWNDLFKAIAEFKGWAPDTIKCMALVESHPMAFEIEPFIFNLKDHLVGLNLGRWDYMASLIHFNLHDPAWVLPDRNTIVHDVPFFQNLRTLIPDICHKRGILAIGGMTALYPSRQDPQLNDHALKALEEDKRNEASCLMDGAWTGHPDQNEIALAQFPAPNQLDRRPPNADPHPDLRPVPKGVGRRTVQGTRDAVRTVIRYRYGYLSGKGASLIQGYMEDLATDRIYRLMIAQRLRHRDTVSLVDSDDQPVPHTPEFICRMFDEELDKILRDLGSDADLKQIERYRLARKISEEMIVTEKFDPV